MGFGFSSLCYCVLTPSSTSTHVLQGGAAAGRVLPQRLCSPSCLCFAALCRFSYLLGYDTSPKVNWSTNLATKF